MSRTTHVVRSDSTAVEARARSSADGCTILCYRGPGQTIGPDDEYLLLGPIPLTVTDSYERIFVAATINGVMDTSDPDPDPDPDPAGPGAWTVTFAYTGGPSDAAYHSGIYFPSVGGVVTLTRILWGGWPPYRPFSSNGIQEQNSLGDWTQRADLMDAGSEDLSEPLQHWAGRFRLFVNEPIGPCECTFFLWSDEGEGQPNIVIETGS